MAMEVPQVQDYPILTDAQVTTVLERSVIGAWVAYRSAAAPSPDKRFASVCVSYKQIDSQIGHNIIYVCARAKDEWTGYRGWVCIHPEPWETTPQELLQGNMMWATVQEMADALPDLTEQVNPFETNIKTPIEEMYNSLSYQGESQELAQQAVSKGIEVVLQPRTGKQAAEYQLELEKWQGQREDRTLYDLLVAKEYTLASAVAGTASRFGAELPALIRLMILHGHVRTWAIEMLEREMESATPLGLLQAESSSMLLWMVTTEVAGCPFLAMALGPTVGDVCRQGKYLEMDPAKVDPKLIPQNSSELAALVTDLVNNLSESAEFFPLCCSQILFEVEGAVSNTFGLLAATTVSRYLYHRFLLEAILAPAAIGITDVQPDDYTLRTLSLIHQIMEKLCTPDGEFSRADAQERHLVPLNHVLDACRAKLDGFTATVVGMGAPLAPVLVTSADNGGVEFQQEDVNVLHSYLKDRFVEMFSSISDIRSEAVASEITQRLRPLLFRGPTKGPQLPIGHAPSQPHPIGLTTTAYQSRVPPRMGTESPAVTAQFQHRSMALNPPSASSAEASGHGMNAVATGEVEAADKVGVGVIFRKDAYGLFHVLTMTKGGPAETSNVIEVGDVIMEINGRQLVGMSLSQLKHFVMGPVGTPVKLVFERPRGPSSERYEVTLFRGNLKITTNLDELSRPDIDGEGEGMRVFQEMSKLVSEVDELQQRRMRAEKALHAAEQLRQEYENAAIESENRCTKLEDEINEVNALLKKTRGERDIIENKIEDLKQMYADIASGKIEAPKPKKSAKKKK
uniref:PDZ domain-containing protein n=3 Tax=Hemiselmis andersenii TaxID=464988 RepID=A0A6U2E2N2_HEMAN